MRCEVLVELNGRISIEKTHVLESAINPSV
jgi:hypothetical protein